MIIALTGSSSSGKTTLARSLLLIPSFRKRINKLLSVNARSLLDQLGHKSMDSMGKKDFAVFQLCYFLEKRKMESGQDNYLTDRSFVDIAAYWSVKRRPYDPFEREEDLVTLCREEAKKYDLHIYLPFGLIPFQSDGYRSEKIEFNRIIDQKIMHFLESWDLERIILDSPEQSERVTKVINWVISRS